MSGNREPRHPATARVDGGLGITSATTMCGRSESTSRFRCPSTSGNRPTDVALTTTSADSGRRYGSVDGTNVATTGVRSSSSSTSWPPRRRLRLTTVIDAAPARAVSTVMARAAPPAPNTTTCLSAGSTTERNEARKPWPSVFSPTNWSPCRTAQLTAPMIDADAASSSRCAITATLWGSEQLNPAQPIARAPRTASPRSAGATSQLR